MYCPQCATPNAGDAKFCRSCGMELESVALVLSGKSSKPKKANSDKTEPQTAQDWLEKRIEGITGVTRGSILLTVSLLLGIAMALFMPGSFDAPWIVIWSVFFGWMAVWGGIEIAYGLSIVLESKARLRLMGLTGKETAVEANRQQSLTGGEPPSIAATAFRSTPRSVTEATTRHLDEPAEK
jgi:hypothetical protein